MKKNKITEMKLKRVIKKEFSKIGKTISTTLKNINRDLSSFNSPGLKVTFTMALKKSLNAIQGDFDQRIFDSIVNDYYKGR